MNEIRLQLAQWFQMSFEIVDGRMTDGRQTTDDEAFLCYELPGAFGSDELNTGYRPKRDASVLMYLCSYLCIYFLFTLLFFLSSFLKARLQSLC